MALVKCPDCGSEISDAAPNCLKCGRPLQVPIDIPVMPGPAINASAPNAQGQVSVKLTQKTWFIVLTLFFCFPVGLPLMWMQEGSGFFANKIVWKIAITIFLGVSILANILKPTEPSKPAEGVWKDSESGLMWQIQPTGGNMSWSNAKEHCKSLSLGGESDWRLPTISELRSLIRDCTATQEGGACNGTDSCQSRNDSCDGCTLGGGPGPGRAYWPPEISGNVSWYWSSDAIFVGFHVGDVNFNSVTRDNEARCVR